MITRMTKQQRIKLTILNKNITIDTEKGISEGFVISSNGNQVMTSYAEAVPVSMKNLHLYLYSRQFTVGSIKK